MRYTEETLLQLVDETIARGPFAPTWESLCQMKLPAWFDQEHFGIFIHWGPNCVPAATNEWYPRNMYLQGMPAFEHHIQTYGPQKEVGYQDLIAKFHAEQFQPEHWLDLIQQAGAGYICQVAEHHDGFQMYQSELSHWNSVEKGPHRDVLAEMKAETERRGLHFAASSHRAEHWWFMGHGKEFDSDIKEPLQKGDLYWPAMPEPDPEDLYSEPYPSEEFLNDWLARTAELILRYQPEFLYFDWWIQHQAFKPYLKRLAAFYYNCGHQWGKQVFICYKHDAMQFGAGLVEMERGGFDRQTPYRWQTDTAVARNSWCYTETLDYKSSQEILCTLIDVVSKNGNMLLNIGPKADGTIPEGDAAILREIGAWMSVNGAAIRGAKPWRKSGEGPTVVPAGQFTDQKPTEYSSEDFRFTCNCGKLYAIALRCPEDGQFVIRSFAHSKDQNKPEFHGIIQGVSVLGHPDEVSWTVDTEGLHVSAPGLSSAWPVCIQIDME